MPVIINEFEVVMNESPRAPERQAEAETPAGASPVTPQTLADVLRHQAERLARLAAH